MKLKVVTLLSICLASVVSSFGQIRLDPFYPYARYQVGVGVGYSQLYGDWDHTNSGSVIRINVQRNTNEWVGVNLQVQRGSLSNYESRNDWTNGLSANNNFTAVALQGRMCIGEIFNSANSFMTKTIFGLYIGAGAGYMWNDISRVTTKFHNRDRLLINDYNSDNIKTKTQNFYIPLTIGIDLHLTRRCMLNVNYEYSYCFSDYVDGYNFQQPTATNRFNDMFSVLSFGLNFYVGRVGTGKVSNYRTRH